MSGRACRARARRVRRDRVLARGPEACQAAPAERERGGGGVTRPGFVLHAHRKPRPHFDLRLEEGGVLRSWAVPKGLPTEPTENRLAVEVADHELEHLTYTDADKSIADIGWWEEHDRD